MPRTVKVSLKGITAAIERAHSELTAASKKTKDRQMKEMLSAKIASLEAIDKQVRVLCVPIPTNPPTHFILIPID